MNPRDLPIDAPSCHRLTAAFQPIVSLSDGSIVGHEGLIRGPALTSLERPEALFAAARAQGMGFPMEIAAARRIIERFAALRRPGYVAVNFSAPVLERLARRCAPPLEFLLRSGVAHRRVVIELTEHARVRDCAMLRRHMAAFRAHGMALALDDFGAGHSRARLWADLGPEYVKIDRSFVNGLHADVARRRGVESLVKLARGLGTKLVAEGVEDASDFRVLCEIGVDFGQGFLLGRPRAALPYSTSSALT